MHKSIFKQLILRMAVFILLTLFIPTLITIAFNKSPKHSFPSLNKSGKKVIIHNSILTESLDVEEFLPCVILNQYDLSQNDEFLKAYIVVMRTYILGCINDNVSIDASKLGLNYMSYTELEDCFGDSFSDVYQKICRLISETSMHTITKNNKLITPYYHTMSNGKTRSGFEILGDEFSYLGKTDCNYDATSSSLSNTISIPYADFAKSLRGIDSSISISDDSPLTYIQIVSKDSSGYIISLSVNGVTIDGNDFCNALSIPSACFSLEDGNNGLINITYYGLGHGLGLSLNEAQNMAAGGSSYLEILNYFYNNVDIK